MANAFLAATGVLTSAILGTAQHARFQPLSAATAAQKPKLCPAVRVTSNVIASAARHCLVAGIRVEGYAMEGLVGAAPWRAPGYVHVARCAKLAMYWSAVTHTVWQALSLTCLNLLSSGRAAAHVFFSASNMLNCSIFRVWTCEKHVHNVEQSTSQDSHGSSAGVVLFMQQNSLGPKLAGRWSTKGWHVMRKLRHVGPHVTSYCPVGGTGVQSAATRAPAQHSAGPC